VSVHALSVKERLYGSPQDRSRQPFLDALEHIEYGKLTLITPEGSRREFIGKTPGPDAQLKLYDWHVLDELVARGEMGFAEAYVQGRWGSENLAELLTFGLVNSPSLERFFHGNPWYIITTKLRNLTKRNSIWGSRRNIMAHYDLGNEFYELWLDKGMTYSCALFGDNPSRTLEEAQAAKYARVLEKINAKPGDHILDIGCGWGGFAEAAAKKGLRVCAISLSDEQVDYATKRMHDAGLQHQVTIKKIDYRHVMGEFDHIVSIGMFEHVGERYWRTYFECIKKHLKPGGKALIQTITLDDRLFEELHGHTGFMEEVIFPGGMLPSKSRFCSVAQDAGLTCHEIFAFGQDYVRTLQHWMKRFHTHIDEVRAQGYDEAFLRLWHFYLCACIASFTSRRTSVMQTLLTHGEDV